MLSQQRSDALNNWLIAKIAAVNYETAAAREIHAEAPNRSEYFDMKFDDSMSAMESELAYWLQVKRDAEDIEIEDVPAVLPTMATARLGAFALGTLAVLGLFLVGAMFGASWLFENSEIGY